MMCLHTDVTSEKYSYASIYLLHPIVLLIPTQSINTSKLPVNLQLVFFQI